MQELEPLLALSTETGAARSQRPPVDNQALGMLWYACSSFFFAAMGACSKSLGIAGYQVWQITLVRAVIIMSLCLWALNRDGARGGCHARCRIITIALRVSACPDHAEVLVRIALRVPACPDHAEVLVRQTVFIECVVAWTPSS
jgi:hypothetical protein